MAKSNRQGTPNTKTSTTAKVSKAADAVKPAAAVNDDAKKPKIIPARSKKAKKLAEPEKDIPVPQAAGATNPIPENEMEVHYHPEINHKHKPWKEYLLEGLMIFIAVMMGFVAENVREAITNSQHVQELTSQLVQDLKVDTSQLNDFYQEDTKILRANDSLITLLQQPLKKENTGQMLKLAVASHSIWLFHPSAGAIAAIKSELHLKQFSSSRIISYIADYEKHIELLHTVQDITAQYQRSYIDPFLLNHFTAASLNAGFNRLPVTNPETRNLSQEDIIQLGADMVLVKINTNELLLDNRRVKNDAVKLLEYVKKQYNPADDASEK